MKLKNEIILALSLSINIIGGIYWVGKKVYYSNKNFDYKREEYQKGISDNKYYFIRIERYKKFLKEPVVINKTIFLGNSLINNFDLSVFKDTNILNRGISGDRITDLLNRLDETTRRSPKKIFLEIGVNDIFFSGSPKWVLSNYIILLAEIKKKLPKTIIYVNGLLPTWDIEKNKKIKKINNELTEICKKENMIYIDLYKHFLKEEKLDPELSIDIVHLNLNGYMIWQKIISKYL
jgi:lysophospholipase L1-like esterase